MERVPMLFNRNQEVTSRKYVIGFDLGEQFCQVSYALPGKDPVTWGAENETPAEQHKPGAENRLRIPTVLTKKNGANNWYCGEEAEVRARRGEGTLVRHILSAAVAGRGVMVEGQEYDPASLLALYVRRVLSLISNYVPTYDISEIMFTCARMDQPVVDALDKVRNFLDLPVDGMSWENHLSSFYSYMLMQPASMHERDVLLCEYDGSHPMMVYRLCYHSQAKPVTVYVQSEEFRSMSEESLSESDGLRSVLPSTADRKDEEFLAILKKTAPEGQISSVFLIGEGFADQWMKESLSYIAFHRRVFLGNNLYSKGAAYSAGSRRAPRPEEQDYLFLGENKLRFRIGVMTEQGGQNVYTPVSGNGGNWYETDIVKEYIVTGDPSFHLVLTPLTGGDVRDEEIRLTGLARRTRDRTIRIEVRFTMPERDKLHLHIEDVGFGEISASSGLKWDFDYQV